MIDVVPGGKRLSAIKVLDVKVQPKSAKPGIEVTDDGSFRIRVSSPPEKGKANKEVIEILAAHFNVPRSRIRIVSGGKSRNKRIEVSDDAN